MPRTAEELREHYEVEKELANRLRTAPAKERKQLYPVVYQELYRRIAHHPRTQKKEDPAKTSLQVKDRLALLQRFLSGNTRFLEIGAGDCSLTLEVAKQVEKAYAFEVAKQIRPDAKLPPNFDLIISEDGCVIPLPDGSFNLAYSNQVMEHIHPDDAREQLGHIFRVLAPGGKYICITPNQASGPHDVSRYFVDTAEGFHLKEYRVRSLEALLRQVGFTNVEAWAGIKLHYFRIPVWFVHMLETVLLAMPYGLRSPISSGSRPRATLAKRRTLHPRRPVLR